MKNPAFVQTATRNDPSDVGLDLLLKLLVRVKDTGWAHALEEDILGGESSFGVHGYSEPLLSLRQAFHSHKLCMSALEDARQHLGKKIRTLKKLSTPLVLENGIKRIPDEVLSHIFEIGHLTHKRKESFALPVSHVSHRFRRVAIGTPLLWTSVSTEFPQAQLIAFMARAGQVDLDVTLHSWDDFDDDRFTLLKSFLQVVGPLSHRWTRLSNFGDRTERQMTTAGFSVFPRLKYLNHYGYEPLKSWSMPMLTNVDTCVWAFQLTATYWSQLTDLQLDFNEVVALDVARLSKVLQSAVNLQKLSFEITDCTESVDGSDSDSAGSEFPQPPHSVPIETLKIHIDGCTSFAMIRELYSALAYLAPSTVEISLAACNTGTADNLLYTSEDTFFPYGSEIRLYIAPPCHIFDTLETLVESCNIAHSVHFELPHAIHTDYQFSSPTESRARFSSLRHLSFRNCDTLPESPIEILAQNFFSTDEDEGLKLLEIICCKKISEDFLLDLQDEFGERIRWII